MMLLRLSFWFVLAIVLDGAAHVTSAPTSESVSSTASTASHSSAPTSSSTSTSHPLSSTTRSPSSTAASPTTSSSSSRPSTTSTVSSTPISGTSSSSTPPTSISTTSTSSSSTSSSSSQSSSPAIPTATSVPIVPHGNGKKNPKRGLGYAGSVPGDMINANQTDSVISWVYNWASSPPDYIATSNIPYVPMQWGSVGASGFQSLAGAEGATTILTFNEPDNVDQANMDPVAAAGIWMQFIEPMKAAGFTLGGPAVTAASTGQPWLTAFLQACTNCSIDFMPIHWYGEGIEGFYSYLFGFHANFPQYPIWITEFAETSNNLTEVTAFLNTTITLMDTLDWVERYAWFGYFRPREDIDYNFLDEDGGLTPLGEIYLGASTIHTEALPSGPSASQTVDGADIPGQAPPTSWPALSAASSNWKFSTAKYVMTMFIVTVFSGLFILW